MYYLQCWNSYNLVASFIESFLKFIHDWLYFVIVVALVNHTRVIIRAGSDYINASFVEVSVYEHWIRITYRKYKVNY